MLQNRIFTENFSKNLNFLDWKWWQVIRKKYGKNFFFASLKSLKKEVGSISQIYGSWVLDPDPHQNVTDPQHWKQLGLTRAFALLFNYSVSCEGVGVLANREVIQALETLTHFNNMTNGSLFGAAGFGQVSDLEVPRAGAGSFRRTLYSAKPAQRSSHTGPPTRHRMDTVPAYVDWRACTATPLSGLTEKELTVWVRRVQGPRLHFFFID